MGTKVVFMLAIVFAIDLAAYWFGRKTGGGDAIS
jgi:hypothetical protein